MGKRNVFNTASESLENQQKHAGQGKKKFTIHDLIKYQPKTKAQKKFFDAWENGSDIMFNIGAAGTGKSAISINCAFRTILEGNSEYRKLIIIRSAISGIEIGHLPGELEDKQAVYELPYRQLINEMFTYKQSYDNLKAVDKLEFMLTSFCRGQTFDNCIIFVDEAQNMDFQTLHTLITRVGENSTIIFAGDTAQDDLKNKSGKMKSGLSEFLKVMNHMKNKHKTSVEIVEYNAADVVRSGIVRDYLISCYELGV